MVRSETTTTATALSAGAIRRGGRDVLDAADLHAGTGEGAQSRLGTGTGGLSAVTTSGADLDVPFAISNMLVCRSIRHRPAGRAVFCFFWVR